MELIKLIRLPNLNVARMHNANKISKNIKANKADNVNRVYEVDQVHQFNQVFNPVLVNQPSLFECLHIYLRFILLYLLVFFNSFLCQQLIQP